MKVFKIISLTLAILLTFSIHATHVLPIFSGGWYTDLKPVTEDSCGKEIFQYTNLEQNTDKNIADRLLPTKPRTDCAWKAPALINTVPIEPVDFVGNTDDWNKIMSQKGAKLAERWRRDCDTSSGTIDSEGVEITPQYVCPSHSRYTFDAITSTLGCNTTPDACMADVVGRDLKIPGATWAGHVGLTYAPWSVIEVLNDNVVLHLSDSLTNFQTASKFWGDVYSLPEHRYIDSVTASTILEKGAMQAAYDPEYTLTASYQPGGNYRGFIFDQSQRRWNKVETYHRAIFRCDTFVDYTYLAGAKITLPTGSSFILPESTYSSFLKKRYISSTPPSKQFNQNKFFPFKQGKTIITPSVQQNVKQILSSNSSTKAEKTILLWSLAQEYKDTSNKDNYYYILDTIGFLHTSTIEAQLIETYKETRDINTRRKLLSTIVQGITFVNKSELKNINTHAVILVQKFLRSQLLSEKSYVLLKQLIYLYPTVVMPSQSYPLILGGIDAIAGKYFIESGKKYSYISRFYANTLKARIALMDKVSQNDFFTKILLNARDDKTLAPALCVVLQDYPIEGIEKSVRTRLFKYISRQNRRIGLYVNRQFNNIKVCDVNTILSRLKK